MRGRMGRGMPCEEWLGWSWRTRSRTETYEHESATASLADLFGRFPKIAGKVVEIVGPPAALTVRVQSLWEASKLRIPKLATLEKLGHQS